MEEPLEPCCPEDTSSNLLKNIEMESIQKARRIDKSSGGFGAMIFCDMLIEKKRHCLFSDHPETIQKDLYEFYCGKDIKEYALSDPKITQGVLVENSTKDMVRSLRISPWAQEKEEDIVAVFYSREEGPASPSEEDIFKCNALRIPFILYSVCDDDFCLLIPMLYDS